MSTTAAIAEDTLPNMLVEKGQYRMVFQRDQEPGDDLL